MTLAEARSILGLERGATPEEVVKAFRRRARHVHPDRHPGADDAARAHHAREFDRAREARDILLLVAREPVTAPGADPRPRAAPPRRPGPASGTSPASGAAPASAAGPERPEPTSRRAARAARAANAHTDPPPRTTLRFDEFVSKADAEGFGPGRKSRPYRDVARIIVWGGLGVLVVALISVGAYFAAVL